MRGLLPVEHLSNFVKAAQRKQHQDGFGLLVDLGGAEVLGPALQNVRALGWAQPHLQTKDARPAGANEKTRKGRPGNVLKVRALGGRATLASQAARFHSP